MVERACVKRLQKEYRALCKEPVSNMVARPSLNDILEWHYVLEGSEGTPFAGGFYYGKIKFPPEYPFKPPSISMTTPNGRFAQDRKICLSMSDFHPETWNPMWSVSSILTGLLSFMMDNSPTTGSISTTEDVKKQLARSSLAYNCKNPAFRKLFPEYVEKHTSQQQATKDALETHHPLSRKEDLKLNQKVAADVIGAKPGGNGENADIARRQRKKIPLWLMFVLITVISSVMALPLYQL